MSLWELLEEESIIAHKLTCSCDRHNFFLSISAQGAVEPVTNMRYVHDEEDRDIDEMQIHDIRIPYFIDCRGWLDNPPKVWAHGYE